ncbi:MAG: hypothetical protein QOC82_3390 [Frankiaceae bacterium]|nr:hypothetical protein [Frankiaceae bacterium]MDQ1699716.1 hypothetical protein [Frankiaceae bacterium]
MTGDDQRLHGAFADLLGTPPPHADPMPGIQHRVGRIRRSRNVIGAATASVTIVAAAAVIYGVTRPSPTAPHKQEPTTQVVVINPQLSLRIEAEPSVAVGAEEQVSVVLTGTGEPADDYGLRVAWGDGGLDRVFGSADCHTGAATSLDVQRVFAHHYLQAGPQRIIVELTRCGVVQARNITRITVTPEH